jgi:hypothetical protein
MKSAEEYLNKNYGKAHLDRCIELNDKQSIFALMEEFADSEVKNLTMHVVIESVCTAAHQGTCKYDIAGKCYNASCEFKQTVL